MEEFRAVTVDHVAEAAELIAACASFRAYGFTPERAARFLAQALSNGEELIGCMQGSRMLGLVWLQRRAVFGASGYVKLLAVHPGAQKKGIGRGLLAEAERQLMHDDPNVFLLVTSSNTAAQAFYARLGYQAIGRVDSYVLPGVDEVIMRRTWGPIRQG